VRNIVLQLGRLLLYANLLTWSGRLIINL